MLTDADRIVARATRQAFAEGVAHFAKHFGHTVAVAACFFALGLAAAWVAWLFYFAAVETWTVLVSPAFIAGAELVAFAALAAAWRLLSAGLNRRFRRR